MPTSGNTGCAIATCRTRSTSSPSTFCPTGRIFRCRRRSRPPMSTPSARQVAAAFPNKEIVIGEVGWPSAGRMREAARPSPSNQARVIEETLALAHSANISASTSSKPSISPGSVGSKARSAAIGASSIAPTGRPKFGLGGAVSDHPHWRLQALAGILLAAMTFGGALLAGRGKTAPAAAVAQGRGARRSFPLCCSAGRSRWFRSKVSARRLAALAGLCGRGGRRADRLRRGVRARPRAADFRRAIRPLGRAPRCIDLGRVKLGFGPDVHRAGFALGANRARSRLRSALSRHSVRAAERGSCAVPGVAFYGSPRAAGSRAMAETIAAAVLAASRLLHRLQRNASPIGRRCGFAPDWSALPSFWCGRGPRQAENEHASRKRRKIGIVQDDAKACRGERKRDQHDRRPQQVEQCGGERNRAEHLIVEQHDRQPKRAAEPGLETGLAGQRDIDVLDRHVAQIKRLADREKCNGQQPIRLPGGRAGTKDGASAAAHIGLLPIARANHHGYEAFAISDRQQPARTSIPARGAGRQKSSAGNTVDRP